MTANLDKAYPDDIGLGWSIRVLCAELKLEKMVGFPVNPAGNKLLPLPLHRMKIEYADI